MTEEKKAYSEQLLDALEVGLPEEYTELKKVFTVADLMVNNLSFDKRGLIDKVLESSNKMRTLDAICHHWIKEFGGTECLLKCADARNEYSINVARILYENRVAEMFVGNSEPAKQFVVMWTNAHKTLQQTFAGFLFSYIRKRVPQIDELFDDKPWDECGFI